MVAPALTELRRSFHHWGRRVNSLKPLHHTNIHNHTGAPLVGHAACRCRRSQWPVPAAGWDAGVGTAWSSRIRKSQLGIDHDSKVWNSLGRSKRKAVSVVTKGLVGRVSWRACLRLRVHTETAATARCHLHSSGMKTHGSWWLAPEIQPPYKRSNHKKRWSA